MPGVEAARVSLQSRGNFARAIKRILDVALSFTGLILLLPIMIVIALFVVADSGWPSLFTQMRVGQNGRRFRLYKFRTMVVGAENMGAGLYTEKNDPRYTRVGVILCRYSLDELPQLWNVLKGDESLVGPRAMVPLIANKLNPLQNLRHLVRPGLTGWAQINGRNTITWSKRVELDNWYIDHWSLGLDLQISLRTIPAVITSRGVLLEGSEADVDDLDSSHRETDADDVVETF